MAHPSLDLGDKTAVVIGGTSGVGPTLAQGLAQAGANVVPSGCRADLVQSAAEAICKLRRRTLARTCDVARRSTLEALRDAACAEFGNVDILVKCAGITKRAPTLDLSESEWNSILNTNLNGTLHACQVFGLADD